MFLCLVIVLDSMFCVLHRCFPFREMKEKTIVFSNLNRCSSSCRAISCSIVLSELSISATISLVIFNKKQIQRFVNQDTSHDFLWAYVHNQYTICKKNCTVRKKRWLTRIDLTFFLNNIFQVFKSAVHRIHRTTSEGKKLPPKATHLFFNLKMKVLPI